MDRVRFEIADGTAICPFNGESYGFTATLTLFAPARLLKIEKVIAWREGQHDFPLTAEEIAMRLATFAYVEAMATRAIAEVRHETVDGVTLTVRTVMG